MSRRYIPRTKPRTTARRRLTRPYTTMAATVFVDQLDALDALSFEGDVSRSALVREALASFLAEKRADTTRGVASSEAEEGCHG